MFDKCTFEDNYSEDITPNIFIISAQNVVITNSVFKNSPGFKKSNSIKGNFL